MPAGPAAAFDPCCVLLVSSLKQLTVGQVLGEIDSKQLGQGFRTPGLIRFVSQDTGYLSPTSDGPRMFVV